MFVAQIGCAAIGVLAFTILGPGWLARSAALATSIAFMIYTRSAHPPGNTFFLHHFSSLMNYCFFFVKFDIGLFFDSEELAVFMRFAFFFNIYIECSC